MLKYLLASIFYIFAFPAFSIELPEDAQRVLARAQQDKGYEQALQLSPTISPTSDGRSFYITWISDGDTQHLPSDWIVSLHGHDSFATNDLVAWAQHLKGKHIGLISLQWWMGTDDNSYYAPHELYREIDIALRKLPIKPKRIMLEGFSRGSANIYAVQALDNAHNHYFTLTVANAGGSAAHFPPNEAISNGKFGATPFYGSNWVTVCGMHDPNPERDGCPAMRRSAKWVEGLGGQIVDRIEDERQGHGALHMSAQNTKRLLDSFFNTTN